MASQLGPDDPTHAISAIAHAVPLGHPGTPDECGELCAFLASNEASYITGTQTVIDGGPTLPETTSMGQIMSETQTTELMQDSALFDDVAKQALGRYEFDGDEANDLAVRVARAATGGTGVIVTSEAYHGNTALITGLSPSIGTDQPMPPDMRMIPTPDTWRLGTNDIGAWMAARVAEQIADMRRHGFKFAALLVDSRASISSKTPWKRAFCSKTPSSMRQNVTLVWEMCVGRASSSASTS